MGALWAVIRAVILFLLVMAAIGMIGNALFPGSVGRAVRRRIPLATGCPRCGRYVIGRTGCDCGKT